MITINQKIEFSRVRSGRRRMKAKPPQRAVMPAGQVPRISKLMALAIRFEGLIRDGQVSDQSELARLAHVTQPRMTQIMNLLHLAPDIQEALLFLPAGRVGERHRSTRSCWRPIAAEIDWGKQREMWVGLNGCEGGPVSFPAFVFGGPPSSFRER